MNPNVTVNRDIPDYWKWVTLEDIGIVVSGGTPSTKEPEFWNGNIPWVTPADLSNYNEVYISKGRRNISNIGLEYSSAILLPENSIIFSSRAPIGYVAITKNELATNQGFKNLIVFKEFINPKFVYYYLSSVKELANEMASGTTFLELSGTKFKQLPFPLAPIEEQNRIVDKIEELFSELDKNIFQLTESKTKIDFVKNKLLDRHIIKNDVKHVKLQKLTDSINYGYTAKSFKTNKNASYRYLRITDIQNGKIDWSNVPYCEIKNNDDIEKFKIENDDILFARSGNTTGKSILINNPENSLYASYLIRIRCKKSVLYPKFLSYFMQTNLYWKQINDGITGIGQPNFNGTKLNNLFIPLLDLKKQKNIVEIIETNFTEIDKLEKEIEETIQNTKFLKSKILQEAFCGKLSPQFLNEISSETLLTQIKSKKNKYLNDTLEINKTKQKHEKTDLDLYTIINKNFQNKAFSYSDVFNLTKVTKDKLNKKFEELEEKKIVLSFFDEKSETIKYKLT